MAPQLPQLPAEIWNHVFGYLSAADKLSARASCKRFRRLVDHGSLWKDWVVVLGFPKGSYNGQFWASLRRRRVSGAVVRSARAKDWSQLAASLPALTALAMDRSSPESLRHLRRFPHLRRLAVRCSRGPLALDASAVSRPQQLTHLSLCDVTLAGSLAAAVSGFPDLRSLLCHRAGSLGGPAKAIRSILSCLPKLEHLSLSTEHKLCASHSSPGPLEGPRGLSSLELIDYKDGSLPGDAMRAMMPGLQALAVHYKRSPREEEEPPLWAPVACDLEAWLGDLPLLSTLVVVGGPPVHRYVRSIPATVTSLVLRVAGLSGEEMAALAAQAPRLLHLHLDPWPSHLGALTARIPRLFPKLRSLKLRHERVPEKDFLHLRELEDLGYLEILDGRPGVSELAGRLGRLTDHRVQVATSPRQRDALACECTVH